MASYITNFSGVKYISMDLLTDCLQLYEWVWQNTIFRLDCLLLDVFSQSVCYFLGNEHDFFGWVNKNLTLPDTFS